MRPTIRGWSAVAVVVFAVAMSWRYGPRALNAVVTPLLVVLVAGLVTTYRAERPQVTRSPVEEGFVGETRTVAVTVETNATVSATLRERVGGGLAAEDPVGETTLEGETEFRYEVRLEERGEHPVGSLEIAVCDVFGLFERRFEYAETTSVLVYPRVHDLQEGATRELQLLADAATRRDRDEFDHLREYQRGDSLRDVHWKSAAKRPGDELVVKEFVADETAGSATVAGECIPGREDDLATAVASVATYLLELDVRVGVVLPEAERAPDVGREHHRDLLALLALVDAGELADRSRADADVLVQADANGIVVVVDGHEIPFDRLRGALGEDGRDAGRNERDTGSGSSAGVAA